MVISYNSVMEVLTVLCQERKLMVTVTESGKGALVTGGIAGLGGLLLGPLGLALGGAVGGCIAAWQAQGKFRPVMEVILHDMRQEQRDRMVESLRNVLADVEASDAIALLAVVQGNQALQQRVLSEMVTFLGRQCNIYVNE